MHVRAVLNRCRQKACALTFRSTEPYPLRGRALLRAIGWPIHPARPCPRESRLINVGRRLASLHQPDAMRDVSTFARNRRPSRRCPLIGLLRRCSTFAVEHRAQRTPLDSTARKRHALAREHIWRVVAQRGWRSGLMQRRALSPTHHLKQSRYPCRSDRRVCLSTYATPG